MVDRDVVAAKLAELAERIARVRRHRPASAEALAGDPDALDLVAFNLMLAIQSCLDVASHLISDQGWPPARDLAGSFRRLREHGVLDEPTAAALGRAAGLRNVIAHVYAEIDPVPLFEASSSGLQDLESFAQQIAVWLRTQASESS